MVDLAHARRAGLVAPTVMTTVPTVMAVVPIVVAVVAVVAEVAPTVVTEAPKPVFGLGRLHNNGTEADCQN